jgi:hypothetical protein
VRSADGKVVTYQQVKALVDGLIGPAPPLPPKMKDSYAHSDAHQIRIPFAKALRYTNHMERLAEGRIVAT